jgi:hypothetical protein
MTGPLRAASFDPTLHSVLREVPAPSRPVEQANGRLRLIPPNDTPLRRQNAA